MKLEKDSTRVSPVVKRRDEMSFRVQMWRSMNMLDTATSWDKLSAWMRMLEGELSHVQLQEETTRDPTVETKVKALQQRPTATAGGASTATKGEKGGGKRPGKNHVDFLRETLDVALADNAMAITVVQAPRNVVTAERQTTSTLNVTDRRSPERQEKEKARAKPEEKETGESGEKTGEEKDLRRKRLERERAQQRDAPRTKK